MRHSTPINLDANATYGLLPEVQAELKSRDLSFLNPSSIHQEGQRARALIEEARSEIRQLLNVPTSARIVFTSGATESNQSALMLPFLNDLHLGPTMAPGLVTAQGEVVISAIEHPAIFEPAARLAKWGAKIVSVSGAQGQVARVEDFQDQVSAATRVVSVMLANNETGHILPVKEIAHLVRAQAPQALFHTDAVQAVGKLPVDFSALGVDLMSISGHKIGALSGVGALIVGPRVPHVPFLIGGAQETRWRAGTENTLGILTFGIAARILRETLDQRIAAMAERRDLLAAVLSTKLPGIRFNNRASNSLPNTINATIEGIRADDLVVALDLEGICISAGAACASGKPEPSPVLKALGLSYDEAKRTIRLSVTAQTEINDVAWAAQTIVKVISNMRAARKAA